MRVLVAMLLAAMGGLAVTGCDAGSLPGTTATAHSTSSPERSASSTGPSTPTRSTVASAAASPHHPPASTALGSPSGASGRPPGAAFRAQLPRGGTRLIGRFRIVAYYGAPGSGALGVLGATSPERAATAVIRRARSFDGYGLPVQPAMELIATVAQRSPGPDHTYSHPIPDSAVRTYLRVAHEHRMLLILDLQPGRASFLSQAERLRPFLRDPSVELALDPEWKVTSGAPGGGRIGSSSAAGINEVGAWLSALVERDHLPDKLLVVHEFTSSMLPDRSRITQHRGVQMVLHADGFGTPRVKIDVFHRLDFPHPEFGIGFKLFLTQDHPVMTPRAVMSLQPRPDVITYQ